MLPFRAELSVPRHPPFWAEDPQLGGHSRQVTEVTDSVAVLPLLSWMTMLQTPTATVGFASVTVNVPPLATDAGVTVNCLALPLCGIAVNVPV